MQTFLQQTTQYYLQYGGGAVAPPGYFPRYYTNVTVAEALEDFLLLYPPPARLSIKHERNEIQFRDTLWKEVIRGF